MSRYIDADAIIEAIGKNKDEEKTLFNAVMTIFTRILTDAPSIDIVRCKECKYYDKFRTWSACTYWSGDPYEQADVNDDDFCSYGCRKEE